MTKPNCENIAALNLTRQGFDCYAPRFRERLPDKTFRVKPLFPRYIFTFVQTAWYCIRSTRGVSYVLMGDNGPEVVSGMVIESIKAREDGEGYVLLDQKLTGVERFHKGDKVRAIEGPLVDKPLIYEGMTSRERVKVLVSMFGRQTPTIIEEKSLVAA